MPVATLTLASLSEQVDTVNAMVQTRPGRAMVAGIRQPPTEYEETQALAIEQDTLGNAMSYLAALYVSKTAIQALTVERINSASSTDPVIPSLLSLVQIGCPEEKSSWPRELQMFQQYRANLTTLDSRQYCIVQRQSCDTHKPSS